MSQPQDADGFENPNYRPGVSALVTKALNRRTGDDPGFESLYQRFYGTGRGAPQITRAPASAAAPSSARAPASREAGEDPRYQQARDAIARGADRAAVTQRLRQMNLDPGKL